MPEEPDAITPAPATPAATLIIRNARLLTFPGDGPLRGEALDTTEVIERADVYVTGERISKVVKKVVKPAREGTPAKPASTRLPSPTRSGTATVELDAAGRLLMPGFVDAHTHACWAGSRLDEWDQKRRGVPYLKILQNGGGIMATVRAVRDCPFDDLRDTLLERAHRMLALGSTTIEVKSGYGLSTEAELKMLRAVREAQKSFPGTLVPTALLGHAIDEAQPGFVGKVVRETLPAVVAEFPGIAVDAFVEKGAWTLEQALLLFARARDLGLPMRVHADQFTSMEMVPTAIKMQFKSVDHLEATTRTDLDALAASGTFGVMLPSCAFHLKGNYARGRHFVEAGGLIAVATNFNPGSAPSPSMPFTIALAVRHLGLSANEALAAATVNPAHLLGLRDRGRVKTGQRADLLLLHEADERSVPFGYGDNPVHTVIAGGRPVTG